MRSSRAPAPAAFFRSDTQAQLLARLMLHPDDALTLKELTAVSSASRATIARELNRLCGAGIVRRVRVGATGAYQAATESPLFPAMADLVERTMGVEQLLARSLAEIEGIDAAAIFGSWAKGRLTEHSDIDLIVIGSPDRRTLASTTEKIGMIAGREINPSLWTVDDIDAEVARGGAFIRDVLGGPLRVVVGDFSRWRTP